MKQRVRILLKGLGILLLMAISGVVWYLVSVFVFFALGVSLHDNYEYYGRYPAIFLTAALVGFFFPLLVLEWLKRIGAQRRRTLFKTILIATGVVFVVAVFFWTLGLLGAI
jgi:hypothetical protein